MLLKSKSTSLTKLVNFLILVSFKIKDFIGHYLKLEVLQDYTKVVFMSKFISKKIIRLSSKSTLPTEEINFLIFVTFEILDLEGHKYEEVD